MKIPGIVSDKIHVAIRSYKRAGKVRTISIAPFAAIWVCESQKEEYEKHYPGMVIAIPDSEDGSLSKKNNAILNRAPRPWTLILDDDISFIGRFEQQEKSRLSQSELLKMIAHYFTLADAMGVTLWGININTDPSGYRPFCPFNLLSVICGPFAGHLNPSLRYDESMGGRDDIDFWLQTIRKHRFTLRVNKYHYGHDHGSLEGGWVSQRTMEREIEDGERLKRKWGSKIVRIGGQAGKRGSSGRNPLNSLVRVPIEGC